VPAPPEPPGVPVEADITPHLGRYERTGLLVEILDGTAKTAGPVMRTTATGPLAELLPDRVEERGLTPLSPDRWLARSPGEQSWSAVTFYALPTGQRYLQFGLRATPKTGPAAALSSGCAELRLRRAQAAGISLSSVRNWATTWLYSWAVS
jgi:hypothetical protein